MTVAWQKEFRVQSFGLDFDKPYLFAVSQWRCLPDGVFLAWRLFWALWHVGWLAWSVHSQIVDEADYDPTTSAKHLIYLTNWAFVLLTCQSVTHLAVVCGFRGWGRGGKPRYPSAETNPWYNKALWVVTSLSFPTAFVVTALYWTLRFKELTAALIVITHAANSFYVACDVLVVASPVRLLHVIYPVILGVVYILFTIVFYNAGGTNNLGLPYIYPDIDWSKPGRTALLSAGACFAAAPLAHLSLFGIFSLRSWLADTSCCGGSRTREGDGNFGDA